MKNLLKISINFIKIQKYSILLLSCRNDTVKFNIFHVHLAQKGDENVSYLEVTTENAREKAFSLEAWQQRQQKQ